MGETVGWLQRRADALADGTADAQGLVGRTIAEAVVEAHDPEYDCTNVLTLTMTDGTVWRVTGSYGGYTGNSCDEYIELVTVRQVSGDNTSRSAR